MGNLSAYAREAIRAPDWRGCPFFLRLSGACNTLKTKGYNLKHNFGHGNMFLASILATLNLLAFLLHTVLELTDTNYKSVRKKLVTRKNFFNDLRALTRYWRFNSWNSLLLFMMRGLEINPADTS